MEQRNYKGHVVIGMGFGDEGKGITTDYLSQNVLGKKTVVRFSGGQQAGHTVYKDDMFHIFSSFGSGTLRNVPTYLSEKCIIDPISIVNEMNVLIEKGYSPKLIIDERCAVTTPLEVFKNQNDETTKSHGSCGRGIFATLKREANHYSLLAGDLKYTSILLSKLDSISKNYYKFGVYLDRFFECVEILIKSPNISIESYEPSSESNCIYEGSQGLLLDQTHGVFPNVTPSDIGLKNLNPELFESFEVYLVSRAYQTRHGNGFMTNENTPNNIKDNPYETNKLNPYQGEFRRSILDLDLYEYALWRHKIDFKSCNFVLTNLDQVEDAYCFTHKRKVHMFEDEQKFITGIVDVLGTPKSVITSHSPYSDNFKVL